MWLKVKIKVLRNRCKKCNEYGKEKKRERLKRRRNKKRQEDSNHKRANGFKLEHDI